MAYTWVAMNCVWFNHCVAHEECSRQVQIDCECCGVMELTIFDCVCNYNTTILCHIRTLNPQTTQSPRHATMPGTLGRPNKLCLLTTKMKFTSCHTLALWLAGGPVSTTHFLCWGALGPSKQSNILAREHAGYFRLPKKLRPLPRN